MVFIQKLSFDHNGICNYIAVFQLSQYQNLIDLLHHCYQIKMCNQIVPISSLDIYQV